MTGGWDCGFEMEFVASEVLGSGVIGFFWSGDGCYSGSSGCGGGCSGCGGCGGCCGLVVCCVESALKFLYGCGSLNQHPDLVASMFILLRDTCRHITGLFVNMWQNGPIVEFTTAGLTMQKRECGRAVLGFIEVLTTCGCLDATSGPIVLHGMLGAAAGSMPSFMLEPISDSMQFMIKAIGRDTMGMWLTQAVAPDGFPSKSMKEKTKTKFVQDFTQADNRSKYKRILKAFCGGKRKGEQGVGFKNKVKKSNKNRNKQ